MKNPNAAVERPAGRLWLAGLGFCAALAAGLFGVLLWQSVSIEPLDLNDARHRFEAVRTSLGDRSPLVRRDDSGQFVRTEAAGRDGESPSRLFVLAYRASTHQLVSADVPIWFIRMKGPAAALALRNTGFDLDVLGLTGKDLANAGRGLVLDERLGDDAILAWTQ